MCQDTLGNTELEFATRVATKALAGLFLIVEDRMENESKVTAANQFFQMEKNGSGEVTLHVGHDTVERCETMDRQDIEDILRKMMGECMGPLPKHEEPQQPSFPESHQPILDWGKMQTLLWKAAHGDHEDAVDKEANAIVAKTSSLVYGDKESLKMRLREKRRSNIKRLLLLEKEIDGAMADFLPDVKHFSSDPPHTECVGKIRHLRVDTPLYAKAMSSKGDHEWYKVRYLSLRDKEPRVQVRFDETIRGEKADILLPPRKTDYVYSAAIRFP